MVANLALSFWIPVLTRKSSIKGNKIKHSFSSFIRINNFKTSNNRLQISITRIILGINKIIKEIIINKIETKVTTNKTEGIITKTEIILNIKLIAVTNNRWTILITNNNNNSNNNHNQTIMNINNINNNFNTNKHNYKWNNWN